MLFESFVTSVISAFPFGWGLDWQNYSSVVMLLIMKSVLLTMKESYYSQFEVGKKRRNNMCFIFSVCVCISIFNLILVCSDLFFVRGRKHYNH